MAADKLSNADFRKLMAEGKQVTAGPANAPVVDPKVKAAKRESRKKRKEHLKVVEERKAAEKEQNEKYRDRASDRRKGLNNDYQDDMVDDYNAGEPADGISAEEKRLRVIEESKFLGGDLEHTHLVKGLDFALLQKTKTELNAEPKIETEPETEKAQLTKTPTVASEDTVICRTRVAKGVYNVLFAKQTQTKNELFQPGRMAYFVDLDNNKPNLMDAPTTVIRSKADCPEPEKATKATTNEIVINKLTQILSYLRAGTRGTKKMRKKVKNKEIGSGSKSNSLKTEKKKIAPPVDDDLEMFGDEDDDANGFMQIQPNLSKLKSTPTSSSSGAPKKTSYFGLADDESKDDHAKKVKDASAMAQEILNQFSSLKGQSGDAKKAENSKELPEGWKRVESRSRPGEFVYENIHTEERQSWFPDAPAKEETTISNGGNAIERGAKAKRKAEVQDRDAVPDSYAECYPGGMDMVMNAFDSDDEVNDDEKKKDEEEEGTEAKTDTAPTILNKGKGKKGEEDGGKLNRKQRRAKEQKSEDKKLDKELKEINTFIEKRKAEKSAGGNDAKKAKTQ